MSDDFKRWGSWDKLLRGRVPHILARYATTRTPKFRRKVVTAKEQKGSTYVVITRLSKAAKVGHISSLIGRGRGAATAGGGLWDRGGRSLRRSDTRVRRRSIQAGWRLTGRKRRVAHVRRALLVGEAKLKAVGTTGGTTVRDEARGTGRSDSHGGLARVVALGSSRSSGGAIHDGNTRSCLLGLLVLHGFAVHRRRGSRLPMLRRATHGDGSGGRVRRGLLRGVGVGPGRRRSSRGQGGVGGGRR